VDVSVKVAVAALLGLVLLCPAPAAPQVYQWTDAAGVVHYTTNPDSIPAQHLDEVRIIDAWRPPGEPTPSRSGSTIPVRGGGPIMVTAYLNGVPLTLMLDTGADRTMLAPGALARAGVDQGSGRRVRIIGVTGESEGREVTLARLDIAGAQLGPVAVVVHQVPAPEVDGLLGRDLLDAFTVTVDPVDGRAILTPR
jgi:predicted aspartyl protease